MHGLAGTTVAVVAESAGVSRGAAQHHFPTREDLVTASVSHMTEVRMEEIRQNVANLPQGKGRTEAVVEILVGLYTGPVFRAALQLWVAASADEALRAQIVPVEAEIGREAHALAVDLLGVDDPAPGVRETVQSTMDMARGLGLANLLTDDSKRRRGIVRQWARTLDAVLAEP